MNLTFTGALQEMNVSIPIMDDGIFEIPETFGANLLLVTSNINTKMNPSQANITIRENDREFIGKLTKVYSIDTKHILSLSLSLSQLHIFTCSKDY